MNRSCMVAAVVAGAAGISCSSGVYDGNRESSVTKSSLSDRINLMEASLDISGCVDRNHPVDITLHRYASIAQSGARSPVFQISVPSPDTFTQDPKIEIMTVPSVLADENSKIGFLVPGNDQWIPDQTCLPGSSASIDCTCSPSTVCGQVQKDGFKNPGGNLTQPTTVMDFAIVTYCENPDSHCPHGQSCQSSACQRCPEGSPCS